MCVLECPWTSNILRQFCGTPFSNCRYTQFALRSQTVGIAVVCHALPSKRMSEGCRAESLVGCSQKCKINGIDMSCNWCISQSLLISSVPEAAGCPLDHHPTV